MRKIISLITVVILFSACKKSENTTVSNTSTTKTDSSSVDHSAPVTTSNSGSLLDLFTKRKDEIVLKLKSISAEQANALYEKYHEENGYLLHQIDEKEDYLLQNFYSEKDTDKKEIKLLNDKLLKHQLQFDELGEGIVEITTKPDFYYSIFKNYVTPDYKEYLFMQSEENKETYSVDAGLVISFKDLGDRVVSWENFMNKYPNSKLMKSVKEDYKMYHLDYLIGEDNTPTYERATEEKYIYPENIQEFNRFLKKYPNSPTVPFIHTFMENFKNENIAEMLREAQDKL
ncbi:TolA-binding protein [Flavobacterium nitrogenifigens]|uniref:TolA-binding protein n=2 Tax=Flavobacterium TaxID=237 RepID=A0A7W7N505_9FLAO|nr:MULTISPECIES: hypothetical protein [Flavobacterium]MBB4800043.1 TolA-binding protein [Flavobacterium nitrogenifigens]MBB6386207.1 TolA-binding protein [Flavobacterium notoginsengisoli]